jgi:predicted RNA-binding Zn ribbon-like protein
MFVDTSRAGRRRYCVPEVCGNRVNVANHRARRRAADQPAGTPY